MLHSLPDKLGERELTRQSDLARLVRLAAELDDGELTCSGFAAELRNRFDPGGQSARGVHLMTYHRAKGLEFDAVFLPRLEEKELPSKLARTEEDEAEERRLFYVGITRARRFLAITWSKRPSTVRLRARPRARSCSSPRVSHGRLARRWPPPIPRSTRRSPRGVSRARRPTRSRPTSSSTTAFSSRSPTPVRPRSTSWPRCRASAPRSSSATARICSRSCSGLAVALAAAARKAAPRAAARAGRRDRGARARRNRPRACRARARADR